MANKEHLALIKQGIEVWNEWREKHSEVIPDLSGADLEEAILAEADLSDVDLTGTRLHKADLFGVNLRGGDLSGADLFGVNLFGANLRGANLTRTKNLTRGQLESAITDSTTVLPDYFKKPE